MPTISIFKSDLESLLGAPGEPRTVSIDELQERLTLVKGEVKGYQADTGELRVELQDSNRPDLWCCEGIARQIRVKLGGTAKPYPFLSKQPGRLPQLLVAPGLDRVRPYVAACAATGYRVTEQGLAQLIQTQEKLADIFGHKRKTVSIGIYRLQKIRFPVTYELASPDDVRFTPLGMDTAMTLSEILMVHPKGLEYGSILAGQSRLPLLRDADHRPLSFPPIINSREIGEVLVGDDELFVEVTGTDAAMVVLTLNIFAVNLADRGAAIQPIAVRYPYETPFGKRVVTPRDIGRPRGIQIETIERALGQELGATVVKEALEAYGYHVSTGKKSVTVKLPPYRQDLMHAMDVVEDVAMSLGYGAFSPEMPSQFTVGGLSRIEQLSDRARELMVGLGFQEIISNILGSPDHYRDAMRLEGTEWGKMVEVRNVMSSSFSCLRQWMIPSLLRVEAASARSFYPHRLFEAGEVAIFDSAHDVGSRTETVLGAMIAHAAAHFSEIHSCLDACLYYLGKTYGLEPIPHPSFLDGRVGTIVVSGTAIGLIGEIHPEVLERWQIAMPVVAFEVNLSRLEHLV
ncbi:phenylalanine--tRNA ligase subunit beta [Candidatus Nitrospira inopinata]|uniref:phenylalanine--tRNA ligase n=1 Tax=Candidatus Nitrospira inopinata TaxID=1715989 RepID=A0A0S4KR47_9BACT|nr:phenylalanine--tRNA ligase subunit beta [Candidatus Nitrospira inopinata]CUQ66239.1 Phenylalanyl-tRNA synthetase, beta subunit [Candidatus Nitrospira inopinata]